MTQPPPSPPQGTPPTAPPSGWNPQPAPAGPAGTGWVQPAAAARGPVTALAKIAGIVILLFGLFWTAIGALILLAGGLTKAGSGQAGFAQFGDAVGNFIAGFGIVIVVLAIIELISGIGILMSKDWARIAGVVYSLLFGVGSILIVAGGASASNVDSGTGGGAATLIFGLVFLVGYAYCLFALGMRWRSRIA
jgi:hypothetical protein